MYEEPSLTTGLGDWKTALVYALLIGLYFIILKLLANAMQQLMSKHRTQKSIIDVDIRNESRSTRVDEAMAGYSIYGFAVTFVRAVMIAIAIIGVAMILFIKVGWLLTLIAAIVLGFVSWWVTIWQRSHPTEATQYRQWIYKIGGNVLTVIILVIALISVAVGLLLLPS